MVRFGIVGVVICLASLAGVADEPNKPDEKAEPITQEKLVGDWEGPEKVAVVLKFSKDKTMVVEVYSVVNGTFRVTKHDWAYEIDPKTNVVKLQPDKSGKPRGVARATKDGKLVVTITELPPALPDGLQKVPFEFIKPKDPKK